MVHTAAVVLAPRAGWGEELPGRVEVLRAALLARATAVAAELAPGRVFVSPGSARAAAAAGLPRSSSTLEGALAHARGRAPGAVLLVLHADVPGLSPALARAALADLEAGCALSVGPTFDGGFYLAAGEEPELGFAEVRERGLHVGLLRAERALRTRGDAEALLADPLCDAAVRRALNGSTL